MNRTLKNLFKYGTIISSIGILFWACNELFIRDWRVKHSEERVQKSIKANFQNRKEAFKSLSTFLQKSAPNPTTQIEFLPKNKINASIRGYSMTASDSSFYDFAPFHFSSTEDTAMDLEFDLIENGIARIKYLDTIFETHHWFWDFQGDKNSKDFQKFIQHAGISVTDLDELRRRVDAVNGETISVNLDRSMAVRYDGFDLYRYEYYWPSAKAPPPPEYTKLADGIYCGLYDSGLFCNVIIFDK